MKKFLILFIFIFVAPFAIGEEIFIYSPKDIKDIDNKNFTQKNVEGSSCHATRLKDNWYITAAHCVENICNGTCVVEISGTPFKTTGKNVFWLTRERTKNSKYDIALINFEGENIPKNSFTSPTILIVKETFDTPRIINRSLKIPFYSDAIKSWNSVFYGPTSKIIFTRDMGLFHGLSGAGVFTNQGELVAITSADASKELNTKFSVFSVFDEEVERFLSSKHLSLYFKHISLQDFENIDKLPKEEKNTLISLDRN